MLVKCAGVSPGSPTDQIKRLYFPEATLNAVQKRLRKALGRRISQVTSGTPDSGSHPCGGTEREAVG